MCVVSRWCVWYVVSKVCVCGVSVVCVICCVCSVWGCCMCLWRGGGSGAFRHMAIPASTVNLVKCT